MTATALGTFYGVGLGPGDPELITRKAVRILHEVDWVFHPMERSGGGTSLAKNMMTALDVPDAKCRAVQFAMSRDRADDVQAYDDTVTAIVAELRQGKSVAWITLGDPFFYSTFIYLYDRMRERFPELPMEVIPGVMSINAAAARAGVPVSRLSDQVAVLPATYGLQQLPEVLAEFPTVFLIKVNRVVDQLLDILHDLPMSVEALYLEKVGTPDERMVTDLTTLRGQALPYFSLIILRRQSITPDLDVQELT